MAYGNYYGQMMQVNQSPGSGLIWVQGEAGAKSYLVAPNTTVALWDSEEHIIYLKSADNLGMPSIKTLDYSIRDNAPLANQNASNSNFVTLDYISTIENKIEALESKLERLTAKKTNRKESVENDT